MYSESRQPQKPTYEELSQENQLLRRKVDDFQAENRALWRLLFETNRRLQLSSAAIKASVSSLLNYDIFWDGTNQHEFLETINTSIDQVGRLINLQTLIFRLQAGTIELERDYQALPEIFSVVQEHLSKRVENLSLEVAFPTSGKPVLVNYEYLVIAIEFLIEAAAQSGAKKIRIQAVERPAHWTVDISGMTTSTILRIQELLKDQETRSEPDELLAPEHQLRLWLAIHLLLQQGVQFENPDHPLEPNHLYVLIPTQAGD
jgi:hypothetical protein